MPPGILSAANANYDFMRKLIRKLFTYGRTLNARWNPWTLRRQIGLLEVINRAYEQEAKDEYIRAKSAESLLLQVASDLLQYVSAQELEQNKRMRAVWDSLPDEIKALGDQPPR